MKKLKWAILGNIVFILIFGLLVYLLSGYWKFMSLFALGGLTTYSSKN